MKNGKIIKWLGLKPLKKPEIKIALIPSMHSTSEINYDGWEEAKKCKQIGTHIL